MILPTKHIPTHQSLLGGGAAVLRLLRQGRTITDLWEQVRKTQMLPSYPNFLLALDFLYALGALDLEDGFIKRTTPNDEDSE